MCWKQGTFCERSNINAWRNIRNDNKLIAPVESGRSVKISGAVSEYSVERIELNEFEGILYLFEDGKVTGKQKYRWSL
ncbi:MAG: hypothetical protein ISS36_00320 [Candidatus Aenigmarchaeota archaeon]|nr:hypothetical protein [Candidatus Aenigmarchaeota archaeon]